MSEYTYREGKRVPVVLANLRAARAARIEKQLRLHVECRECGKYADERVSYCLFCPVREND